MNTGEVIALIKAFGGSGGGSSGGGVLVVNIDEEHTTLDKTWQEIYDAVKNGTVVIFLQNMSDGEIQQPYLESIASKGGYGVYLHYLESGTSVGFFANSASDYPSSN